MVKDDMRCPKCGAMMEIGANGFIICRCGWFESSRDNTPFRRTDTSELDWVVNLKGE